MTEINQQQLDRKTTEEPTFNLKAVVHETSLKPDTLRAWERRYGLPKPRRTRGGHRLYSQYDIDTLKWLIARQTEGLSISHAVNLWHRLIEEGSNPLDVQQAATPKPAPQMTIVGDSLVQLRAQWVEACLNFDQASADNILSQAFAIFPIELTIIELLQTGIAEIGGWWATGEVTVQQEHFASNQMVRALNSLLTATPPPTRPERILIGCPPEEEHTLAPLMMTLFLRRRGYKVTYLGARVPQAQLEATVHSINPKLIIFAAQTLPSAAELLPVTQLLFQMDVPTAIGGRVFVQYPQLRPYFPAHYLGDKLNSVSQQIETLLEQTNLSVYTDAQQLPSEQTTLLAQYISHETTISATVWGQREQLDIPDAWLLAIDAAFASYVKSLLSLGNLNKLGNTLDAVEHLFVNTNIQMRQEQIRQYLEIYLATCQQILGEQGSILTRFLTALLLSS